MSVVEMVYLMSLPTGHRRSLKSQTESFCIVFFKSPFLPITLNDVLTSVVIDWQAFKKFIIDIQVTSSQSQNERHLSNIHSKTPKGKHGVVQNEKLMSFLNLFHMSLLHVV